MAADMAVMVALAAGGEGGGEGLPRLTVLPGVASNFRTLCFK